jgi:hypothetical protein
MTYAELGEARGISPKSAERLAQRRRWPRQVGNDGMARVLVPIGEDRVTPRRQGLTSAPDVAPRRGMPSAPDIGDVVGAAIRETPLREQLDIANQRADRAEQRADRERERASQAEAAERLARAEADGLHAELDARRQWGLSRRLRWALGRKR